MKIVTIDQRSPEWFQARLGRVTSSRAADMLATLKSGGEAAGRRNLRVQLVLERLTGRCQEREFQTPAMQAGIEREVDAFALYEALTGHLLQRAGFLQHDDLLAGASLDGYVGNFEGIVEIKSPLPATHLDYLRTGVVPGEYLKQIRHQLWISGAQWCDWLSFNPDFPPTLQTKLVRVQRNDAEIVSHELAVRLFLHEVEQELAELQSLTPPPAVELVF